MGREERIRRIALVGGGHPHIIGARPKVALGFCFGSIQWPFMRSVIALTERSYRQGEQALVRHLLPEQGLYIGENRNRIVQRFMNTDAQWLLQVDTDIEFPSDLPEKLLELTQGGRRKVLAASVPLSPPLPGCAMNRNPQMPGEWIYVPEEQLSEEGIEVDAVASAILLVHRDVFQAIADDVGQCWFLQTGPGAVMPDVKDVASRAAWSDQGPRCNRRYVHIGEDVLFSMRAEEVGFRSYCAKVPGLRHYKTLPLTHDVAVEMLAPAVEAATP